jgi:hypothetical protein
MLPPLVLILGIPWTLIRVGIFIALPCVRFLNNMLVSDVLATSKNRSKAVCYPYSLVPGMLIDSPLFHKAISTISKQSTKAASSSSATHKPAADRLLDFSQGSSKLNQSRININLFVFLIF